MISSDALIQIPAPDHHLHRFRGDVVIFDLKLPKAMKGTACIRTNLGGADVIRKEIIYQIHRDQQPLNRAWFDIPMARETENHFQIRLPLCDVGHFEAKCFFLPANQTTPMWPPGKNTQINVAPADTCGDNTIYNAFVRQFGPNKDGRLEKTDREALIKSLDEEGYAVIPPSGTFRDLIGELDFIIGQLGCRVIQLLPVHATPTTYARMGRFGSPYAALNFMSVDPALAVFDPAVTPTEQFIELIDAIHARRGKVIMDIAINHTGWAARLHDTHPEWLVRGPDGRIEMPGAWGVTWADLTRLDFTKKDLWRYMARIFLRWCRRGADGFRCDAGYMIPEKAWTYIVACVRDEYPDTIFFLEGLGGPLDVTRHLLNRANMNWAYSELFQNYTRGQIEAYLPDTLATSRKDGVMVHFAETHDNNRLASRSKAWARMRTALCALASQHGAFGFANGVEWYAAAKIDVHQAPSLNWGNLENQVDHIRRLNLILATHPTFGKKVDLTIVSIGEGEFLALDRYQRSSDKHLLILVNLDDTHAVSARWPASLITFNESKGWDLISGDPVEIQHEKDRLAVDLKPGDVFCLSNNPEDLADIETMAQQPMTRRSPRVINQCLTAKALDIYHGVYGLTDLGETDVRDLAIQLHNDPRQYCLDFSADANPVGVIDWSWPSDIYREVVVPSGFFIYIRSPHPFRARLSAGKRTLIQEISLAQKDDSHFVLFTPQAVDSKRLPTPNRLILQMTVYGPDTIHRGEGTFLFPRTEQLDHLSKKYSRRDFTGGKEGMFLDTNGRGAMLRMPIRWGELYSSYDAILAANLHADIPEDRWVMFTRCRGWVVFQGYSTELNSHCLDQFDYEIGRGGRWCFMVPTGQGEYIRLNIAVAMVPDMNAIVMVMVRLPAREGSNHLNDSKPIELILRPDIEDRRFHDTTKAYTGPEQHFPKVITPDRHKVVFEPTDRRRLEIEVRQGDFVHEPEWHYMVHRKVEAERGLDPDSDLFSPGYFTIPLTGGEHKVLTATISEEDPVPDAFIGSLVEFARREEAAKGGNSPISQALSDGLDQFVVKRGEHMSVVAGYPWFLDWGRDSLIAVRGLVAAGRLAEARNILIQFGRFEQNGTLPNMIHGEKADNRDTSDAPLWFFTACADLIRAEKNSSLLDADCGGRTLKTILRSIGAAVINGTPNGVKMDGASGLVYSPAHFTWMDTNHPAGTPRQGYPVEIQALWYAALSLLSEIDSANDQWSQLALLVRQSIITYFYPDDAAYLTDCRHADKDTRTDKAVPDDALRPNQLFAVTLGAVDDRNVCRSIVTACQALVVPGAIRSLAARPVAYPVEVRHHGQLLNDPHHPYQGRYQGDEDTRRKPAYHNGTAWTWVFPTFCEAWAMAWGPGAERAALQWLASGYRLLRGGCIGHLPEIVDGDKPHRPRGCDAQAWGISEFLRVWLRLQQCLQK